MIDKPMRDINVIASELQSALRREVANIIDIGELLLEAKEQLDHTEWLPWLKANFGSSTRSAQNYMSAARFALKYATVAHLKLRPTALYLLGSSSVALDEIEAVLKVAETEWVDDDRANEIIDAIHAERQRETPEEHAEWLNETAEARAKEWQEANERMLRERDVADAEIDDILDGPPPDLTPQPEPAPVNQTLLAFDKAVETLKRLRTKSLSSFAGTKHDVEVLNTVAEFMKEMVGHLKKQLQ